MPADRRHWYRLKHLLPEWQSIGIDHIWIPPGCKGMDPNGNGYDIYDLFDLGEFDQKGATSTKWGSYEDLKEMTLEAKSLGMNVIWDAVLNHKAGADYFEKFQAIAVDPKGWFSKLLNPHPRLNRLMMKIKKETSLYLIPKRYTAGRDLNLQAVGRSIVT